jgi:hypothetical protein
VKLFVTASRQEGAQAAIMALARMGALPFALTRTTVLGVLPAMPTISGQSRLNALLIKLNRMQ